jgi:hypothetical protein
MPSVVNPAFPRIAAAESKLTYHSISEAARLRRRGGIKSILQLISPSAAEGLSFLRDLWVCVTDQASAILTGLLGYFPFPFVNARNRSLSSSRIQRAAGMRHHPPVCQISVRPVRSMKEKRSSGCLLRRRNSPVRVFLNSRKSNGA